MPRVLSPLLPTNAAISPSATAVVTPAAYLDAITISATAPAAQELIYTVVR